ncbi:MAG: ABC-2 family transporter protein [Clostridia bacterium]|nr:ABC-2 family transporter protein [Clostridia bacterium]
MKLYFKFFLLSLKGRMQYKVSFFMTMLGNFVIAFSSFAAVFFLMSKFNTVKGFSVNEVFLCYGIVSCSFYFSECFFRGFEGFSGLISSGRFDRILLFPKSEVFMTLCNDIEIFRLARLFQGILVFILSLVSSDIEWTVLKTVTIFFMLLSGIVLYSSFFILEAGICFFTIGRPEALNIFTYGTREFGVYPLGIYGKEVMRIFTFVFPLALVQYYPLLYVIGKSDNALYCLLPLISCICVIPSAVLWKTGVRHYKSTGS